MGQGQAAQQLPQAGFEGFSFKQMQRKSEVVGSLHILMIDLKTLLGVPFCVLSLFASCCLQMCLYLWSSLS